MNVRWAPTALATVLFARSAVAEESRVFRVSYAAPPGCPTEEAFSAAIESNSARVRRAAPGELSVDIDAQTTLRSGGFEGVLHIRRPDGSETTRVVPAPTCGEATTAMALIATIAIDPEGTSTPASSVDFEAPKESAPRIAASAPSVSATVQATAANRAPPTEPTRASTIVEDTPYDARANRKPHARSWWLGAEAGVGAVSAVAPGLSPDFGAALTLGATRKALLSPLVLLSGHLAESREFPDKEGTSQFRRLAGRLTACPLAANPGPVVLRPCALFEIGELRATGSNVQPALTARSLWLELGATGRAELPLVGPLTLAAELGAVFPLVTDSFYFKPNRATVHEIPPVGFVGSLGLGMRIL